jgi:ZIP Zinc transporter
MALVTEKVIAILIILCIEILFSVLPISCKKCKESPKLISYASCFSSGLFICIVLFHILPHANELYAGEMGKKGYEDSHDYFNWPNLCCLLSFSIVFLFDKVLFKKDKAQTYKEPVDQSSQAIIVGNSENRGFDQEDKIGKSD